MFRVGVYALCFFFIPLILATSARAGFSLGTGATYIRYREDPGAISIGEVAWTIKLASRHNLGSRALQLHTNFFLNAVPYQFAGTKDPPARFYGVNARLAVGPDLGKFAALKLSVGGYVWGMQVANNAYGLRYLTAPQAVIALERSALAKKGRQWTIYGKYAPIKNRTSYEIAAGFAFQLNNGAKAKRAVMLTVDLSRTKLTGSAFNSSDNSMLLSTASLGLSFGLNSEKSK